MLVKKTSKNQITLISLETIRQKIRKRSLSEKEIEKAIKWVKESF
jgi:SOS response regulatory protein OraA/RecX